MSFINSEAAFAKDVRDVVGLSFGSMTAIFMLMVSLGGMLVMGLSWSTVLLGGMALVMFALSRVDLQSVNARHGLMLACLGLSTALVLFRVGYTSLFVVCYTLSLIATGLVASRFMTGMVTLALPVAFVIGGKLVNSGALSFPTLGRDPNLWRDWSSAGWLYILPLICVLTIVAQVSNHLIRAQQKLKRREGEVAASRAAMSEVRSARQEAEVALRAVQRRESFRRLKAGVLKLLGDAITRTHSLVQSVTPDTPTAQRSKVAAEVVASLEPPLQLLNDLMTLNRLNARDQARGLQLKEIVETTHRSAVAAQAIDAVTLRTRLTPGLEVFGSLSHVQQAVFNLILNALEATPRGTIQITTCYATPVDGVLSHALLIVEDTGEGIPDDRLHQVIEPFFSTRPEQSGLGLAVVHAIAEQHDGDLTIESALGVGTRVTLTLPLLTSVCPSAVSPEHMAPEVDRIHAAGSLKTIDDRYTLEPVPATSHLDESDLEPSSWRINFARKLIRGFGVVVSLLLVIHLLIAPSLHILSYVLAFPLALSSLWLGWSPTLRPRLLFGVLLGGTFLTSLATLIFNSFDNPVALMGLTLAFCWSVLLGQTRSALVMGLLFILSIHAAGFVRETYVSAPPFDNLNVNHGVTWYRMAPQVFLLALVMGGTVVGALNRLRQSLQETERAVWEAERLRLQEATEASRLVAMEAHQAQQQHLEATGRFAGGLAHDLRNALQIVYSFEIVALDGLARADLVGIIEAVKVGLMDAQCLLAQFDTDVQSGDHRCLLAEHVRGSLRQLTPNLPERVTLKASIQDGGQVGLSPTEVRRLVTNLINNACDAMSGEGELNVTLEWTLRQAELVVEDNGVGMDAETLEKVFDAYFSTKGEQGTGLGLHAVRQIVHLCNGEAQVESEVGRGTRFRLTFPILT